MNEIARGKLLTALKKDEGRKAKPYQDSRGIWTVGYGHNLQDGLPLSDGAMQQILDDDLADAETRCRRFPWFEALDDVRQAVIVMLAFNVGLGGLGTFRLMLGALVNGDYATAADEMEDSDWAKQVHERSTRLATMMRTGRWP